MADDRITYFLINGRYNMLVNGTLCVYLPHMKCWSQTTGNSDFLLQYRKDKIISEAEAIAGINDLLEKQEWDTIK